MLFTLVSPHLQMRILYPQLLIEHVPTFSLHGMRVDDGCWAVTYFILRTNHSDFNSILIWTFGT